MDMKKILTLLTIGIVAFTSCKEELVQVYSISIEPTELSFNSGGGEETVSVTSTADWELSGDSYWCYASEYSGKGDAEIIFTADPNEDSESNRSATFTFISGDKKATLTVTQEKKEYSISIEPKELVFNADGGEQEITVTSSDEWKVKGESNWCTLSSDSGNNGDRVTIIVDKYDNPKESRTAVFTFECGNKNAALTITQEKKEYSISLEPKELKFDAEGGDQTVTVTSSDDWRVKGESDWCDISVTTGESGDKVTFSADSYTNTEEARTATYIFVCGDKEAELKIEQEAKMYSISVEPTELSFIAAGEEKAVTITSSDEWEFSSKEDWITASKQNGENNTTVKIIVAENYDPEIRTGVAIFRCGNKQSDIQITQEAKEYSMSVEPKEITFKANGEEKEVTVSSSDEWELTADCDWIQTSTSKGDNGASVKITASFNNTSEQRTGSIVFTCGNKTAELELTQEANNFSISIEPAELVFGPAGGEETVKITSSHKWTLTNNLDWITTTVSEGNNGDDIRITATPNNTVDSRSGIVIFTCGNQNSELLITQNPDDSPIIQFKDQYFFEAILEQVDANGDGQISEREASNVKSLSIVSRNAIRGMDELKYFTALEHLELHDIVNSQLTFDLRCCTNLKTLITELPEQPTILLNGSQSLTSVNVSGGNYDFSDCVSLTDVICEGGIFNFNGCSQMQYIELGDITGTLNLDGCTSLVKINGGAVKEMEVSSISLTTMNISIISSLTVTDCPKLENLSIGIDFESEIAEIKLNNCSALTYCRFSGRHYNGVNYYSKIDFNLNSCANLKFLELVNVDLQSPLDLHNKIALSELRIYAAGYYTPINIGTDALDLSKNINLERLEIDNVELSSLDLSNTSLRKLDIDECPLKSLNLNNVNSLDSLIINNTSLTSLNLDGNSSLTYLSCEDNWLSSLSVKGCSAIKYLTCMSNNLSSVDVSECKNLQYFACHSNPIKTLDLRYNTSLLRISPVYWYVYGGSSGTLYEVTIEESTKCPLESLTLYRYNNLNNDNLRALNMAYSSDIIFYAE